MIFCGVAGEGGRKGLYYRMRREERDWGERGGIALQFCSAGCRTTLQLYLLEKPEKFNCFLQDYSVCKAVLTAVSYQDRIKLQEAKTTPAWVSRYC